MQYGALVSAAMSERTRLTIAVFVTVMMLAATTAASILVQTRATAPTASTPVPITAHGVSPHLIPNSHEDNE